MKNPIIADKVLKRGVGLSAAGGDPKKKGFLNDGNQFLIVCGKPK